MKDINVLFLTREEYNAMVDHYPLYMRNVWCRFQRQWSLKGVTVFVPQDTQRAYELRVIVRIIRLFVVKNAMQTVSF